MQDPIQNELNQLSERVVDSIFKVHQTLGPGLLESVYQSCVAHELSLRGIKFQQQLNLPVVYGDFRLDAGLRLDIMVEKQLIIELKCVDKFLPVHKAQLLTYLKLTGCRLGLLVNFNVALIRDGIKRVIL